MHRNVERGAQYNASAQGAEVEECLRTVIQLTQPWQGTIWTFINTSFYWVDICSILQFQFVTLQGI